MLNLAFQNQEEFHNFDIFRHCALLGAGHVDYYGVDERGIMRYEVKSISFENCSQQEFEKVYEETKTYLMLKYGYTEEFSEELRGG